MIFLCMIFYVDYERFSGHGDMALLKEVSRGNEAAFAVLLDRYVEVVSRNAFRIMCDREDSEAVTRKVFISLWNDVMDYDDRFELWEWLLRKTCIFSRIRISRRRILRLFGVTTDVFVQASPKVEDHDDYVTKQAWELYCRASTHLTPLQRAAYALCELEGIRSDRAAMMTGMSRLRMELALQRGAEKIRHELERYARENDYEAYVGFLRKVAESMTDYDRLKKSIIEEIFRD